MDEIKKRIFVAGHNSMVGSAIVRQLKKDENIELVVRSCKDLDLTNQQVVSEFFTNEKIPQVYFAAASIHMMNLDKEIYDANTQPKLNHINVGTGVDCTIRELVETVTKVVGFASEIKFDTAKADSTSRKFMNVDRLKSLGWEYSVSLEEGITLAYQWFIHNQDKFRG